MMRRTIAPLVVVGLFTATVRGETIQLPYVAPDAGQSQWTVQQAGVVQQQGNQPVFGQAGTLTINGQQPQRTANTAEYDDKAKELTMTFTPVGAVKCTRRVQFGDGGVVRIVDLFENAGDRETQLSLSLATNTNFGVNDGQSVNDPKKKDTPLGWAANTGAERAAISLFAGKGTKDAPGVQFQPNNNAVTATMSIKLPGKAKRAVVHWHGTFDNADAAVQWAGQLKEAKAVADLPADVRRVIANLAPLGAALPEGLELLRGGNGDVIELLGGDILRGDLSVDAYAMRTDYGLVTVPATSVAGLIAAGGRQWLVTADGQLFAGKLDRATLPITLAGGQTPAVPLERVARLGYRSTSVDPPEWKFDKPMAFLAGGERFLVDPPTGPIEFVTRYGTLSLSPDQVATILLPPAGSAQQVFLADGSRLSGVLAAAALALRPTAMPTTRPTDIPTAAVVRVQFRPLAEGVGAGAATLGLLGEDTVAARLDQPLRLSTGFDTLTIAGPEVRAITRPRPGQADVQVTTADQSTFSGRLEGATLTLTLAAGPKLTVPVAAVRDYDNPSPYPAAGVVAKVTDAVKRLNDDDWKVRENAEAELSGDGPSIVSVLESMLPTQPPEARDRLTTILRTMKKDLPTPPSRLSPPPGVDE